MKILTTPRMERCIGCHSCSLACARLVHRRLGESFEYLNWLGTCGAPEWGVGPGSIV